MNVPSYEELQDIFEDAKEEYLEKRKDEYDVAMDIKANRAGIRAIYDHLMNQNIH